MLYFFGFFSAVWAEEEMKSAMGQAAKITGKFIVYQL